MINFMRLFFFATSIFLAFPTFAQEPADEADTIPVFNPMDALTGGEIDLATKLLRDAGKADDSTLYGAISLLEPEKVVVKAWTPESPLPPRMARVEMRRNALTSVARIDLAEQRIIDVIDHPGKHPIVLEANWLRARDSFMKDARFIKALEKRGLKLDENILCTPNSAGWLPGQDHGGKHLMKIPCFSLADTLHPTLSRPIEGLMGVADGETGEVVEVYDRETVALPPAPQGYGPTLPARNPPIARMGFGIEGEGNLKLAGNVNAEWLNWRFHVRPDKRAGLIVSTVQFNDGTSWRDMAYQMNLSEMFVPYMDPNPTWTYRTFMDAGEFGLGYLVSTLRPGVDCPQTAAFIDLTFPNDIGGSYVRPAGLCIFERPTGDPAWRHYSSGSKVVDGEPQIELVVRHIPTIGNYDYVIDYVFQPQGNIRLRVGATGFDAIKSVAAKDMESPSAKEDTKYGSLIAPYTVAPNHDHYFNFRLDLDVDGTANSLVRDIFERGDATGGAPRTSLWTTKTQRFAMEGPVATDHMAMAGQILRVTGPAKTAGLKHVPSLWLNAHHDAQSILDANDPPQTRAQFSAHQFWLTRYKPDELWAAGTFPNLNPKDEGLPHYVADGENATASDIVVWYTMGFRHVTRPEDFPILPTFWHEMTMRPAFFFDMDPSMTFNAGVRD